MIRPWQSNLKPTRTPLFNAVSSGSGWAGHRDLPVCPAAGRATGSQAEPAAFDPGSPQARRLGLHCSTRSRQAGPATCQCQCVRRRAGSLAAVPVSRLLSEFESVRPWQSTPTLTPLFTVFSNGGGPVTVPMVTAAPSRISAS
jgi:hypothetical protein